MECGDLSPLSFFSPQSGDKSPHSKAKSCHTPPGLAFERLDTPACGVRRTVAARAKELNHGLFHIDEIADEDELCRRVAGSQAEPEFAPARLGEAQRSAIDPALAAVELGWRPETSLEEGLRTTWASFADAAG